MQTTDRNAPQTTEACDACEARGITVAGAGPVFDFGPFNAHRFCYMQWRAHGSATAGGRPNVQPKA